jgi:hypothetical protein
VFFDEYLSCIFGPPPQQCVTTLRIRSPYHDDSHRTADPASPGKLDELVRDGRMPAPKRIDGRKVWDIHALDMAFDALPSENGTSGESTWDDFRAA